MGGSIDAMPTPKLSPAPPLEPSLAVLNQATAAVTEAIELALHAAPGTSLRDDHARDALANLDLLDDMVRDTRKGVEALP